MSFYARPSPRMFRPIGADLFVLAWIVGWVLVGRALNALIRTIAEPSRAVVRAAQGVRDDMSDAAAQAAGIPAIGGQLRRPFDAAAGNLEQMAQSAQNQVVAIEHVAVAAGIVVAAIPIAVLVALWLPRRIRFFVTNRAARRFLDSQADLDLFALRALATQPLHVLGRISPDPVTAWRSGDREVIDRLADVELRRTGLATAAELRRRSGSLPAR